MRTLRALLVLPALGLSLAACGSDADPAAGNSTAPTTVAGDTTVPVQSTTAIAVPICSAVNRRARVACAVQ